MKIKFKTTYFLKITAMVMIWVCVFVPGSFAQGKIVDAQTLSPSVHLGTRPFLEVYRQIYSTIDLDLQHASESADDVQKGRQSFLEKEIMANLKKDPRYSSKDWDIIERVIKMAKNEYGDKKFPSPSNEFYLHHALETAYHLSQWAAPAEAIAAAVLHRLGEHQLSGILKDVLSEEEFEEISTLMHNFLFITDFHYSTMPLEGAKHDIQNFMNAMIQLSAKDRGSDMEEFEPDYRIMLLVFADKLASISFASEMDRDELIKEIEEMYAPLAGRLGYDEIKRQLLNESFRLSRNAEYNYTRKIFKDYFGQEYEDVRQHLNEMEDILKRKIIENYGESNSSSVKISVRLKGLYEIAEKLKHVKSIESLQDILGIRIVCDCTPEMLYQYSDLVSDNIGVWLKKEYDQRKREMTTKRPQGAIYIDLKKEDTADGFPYEVQIMTKQFHEQRERERAHWSYKLGKKTGQKFDQTEVYAPTGDLEIDFNRVFNELNDWVFVFVQSNGKGGRQFLRAKRLPRGAIVADIAALRRVDLLNASFSGAKIYDWHGDVFYERSTFNSRGFSTAIDYILQPADILVIENNGRLKESHLLRLREKAKTLRAQMMLSLIELEKEPPSRSREKFITSAEKSLRHKFEKAGIVFKGNRALKNFLDSFARSQGLIDREELYVALTYCSWKISISKIIEEAKLKGKSVLERKFLEEEIEFDDFALGQIARAFGISSRDILFLYLGTGQITDRDLGLKMHKINSKPEGILKVRLSRLFQFTVTIPRTKLSSQSQRIRKLVDHIENLLDEQGLKDPEERIKLPKIKGKSGDIKIVFSAKTNSDLKAAQLQNALISSLPVKGKKVEFEKFYDKSKKASKWEIVLQFENYGQDISELTQYLLDEIKSWSRLSRLLNFDVDEEITINSRGIIEVRAILTTDLNHNSIIKKITRLKNNHAIITTSSDTIYDQAEILKTDHKSNLISAIKFSI